MEIYFDREMAGHEMKYCIIYLEQFKWHINNWWLIRVILVIAFCPRILGGGGDLFVKGTLSFYERMLSGRDTIMWKNLFELFALTGCWIYIRVWNAKVGHKISKTV